ncbi:ribosome recycling factor isoform 1 [Schistosoma japonicum]|uniref:Ribosome recycling factor isoform 1 n=2 Tax=Schistosoma japonicum TaxID=6182 RepID=A0A4Z2DKY3_SCHJA|nr:ribosome recycling factor isoform 1 [Schistosoma japonicum]
MNRLLSFHKLSNFSFNIFNLLVWKRVILSPVFSFNSIVHSTVRWKSKGGHAVNAKKVNRSDISPEVLSLLKEDKMNKEFHNVMSHFQSSLIQRLNLRMTPQLFSDILLPEENVKLGHVANLILQNTAHQNMSLNYSQNRMNLGDQCLLIDLTGRPDLFVSARKAVTTFLNPCKDGSEESRIQSVGQHSFTVRLNTIITQESRQKAVLQGQELLHQTIHEMDKIYQSHNKLLNSKQAKEQLSEDALYLAREYLRSIVKEQHKLAETIWNQKKIELEGEK